MSTGWESEVNSKIIADLTSQLYPHFNEPDKVKNICKNIRACLDGLERGLPQQQENEETGNCHSNVVNMPSKSQHPEKQIPKSPDLGRNQLSKLRELVIVQLFFHSESAISLIEIKQELKEQGFISSDSAVNSQLHRLVETKIIKRVDTGIYQRTEATLAHCSKLQTSFGKFLERFNA
ncbi:MAG: hypothetical protein ACRBBN_04130 [Methyloligellaceae bacterium]